MIKKFILLAFLLIVIGGCNKTEVQRDKSINENTEKLNVVFVLVDDLGYADIGAYNPSTFYRTPNIDQLAKDSVLFTDGYAANPVCSPTRAAIMTGKHPTRMQATEWFHINDWPHRVERFRSAANKDFMASEEITIAEIFKDQGYDTTFIGKWHLGDDESLWPDKQGFNTNIGGAGFGFPRGGYFSPYNNPNLKDGPQGEYLTDRLTTEAINVIEARAESSVPFFVFLSYYTVHVPLEAPNSLIEKYTKKGAGSSKQNEFKDEDQHFVSEPPPRKVRVKQNHPTYAAMIEKLDDNVGRIVASLKDSGQYENTIIVFTSDNGGLSTSEGHPTSNLPLRGGKGWLYEGGVRVPLIIRVPQTQMSAGSKVSTAAVSMDFLPTLAALTNIQLPKISNMDGQDLSKLLLADTAQSSENLARALFWHYPHYSNQGGFPGAAVRKGEFKLLQNFEDGSLQLYNLSSDLREQVDIKENHPEKVAELQTLLYAWYKETDANFLRPRVDAPNQIPWTPGLTEGVSEAD